MRIKTNGFKMPNGDEHVFIPPSPTETERSGIKAKAKTTESMEIVDLCYIESYEANY